jgi:hypothetical protein
VGRPTAVAARGRVGAAGTGRAQELEIEIDRIQDTFARLRAAVELSDVFQSIGRLDARLADLPVEIEGLRSRGYAHAGLLEEDVSALQRQWLQTRPRVEATLKQNVTRLRHELNSVERQVDRLSVRNASAISAAGTAVNGLQSQVEATRRSVSGLYGGLQERLVTIEATLNQIDWVLEQFDQSAAVKLRETEAPLLAAEAEWQRDGEEGPKGVLFLTDQRLLFEQKETVATKKLLGIFTTDTKTVQRLLLEVPVHEVEKVSHSEEGGFLGMGKKDILELVLGARAPVSRARFRIQGQESSDWTVWITRAQTGDIDRDREEGYAAEVEAAEARAAAFPAQCPFCLAPLPRPPRGALTVTCEYCGTVITPELEPTETED